jgi:transposase-like protein
MAAKRKSTEEKLAIINQVRQRGDVNRLSKKFGHSATYVSNVINGHMKSNVLVDKVYKALSHRPAFREAIQGGSLKA